MTVKPDYTGWRDRDISLRHRQWGFHVPALDIDFLLAEYDRGKVRALVEYKHEQAAHVRIGHPSVQALSDLATRAKVPAFVVRYAGDFSWFYPTPINDLARVLVPEPRHLSEREWVELLYRLRGREAPSDMEGIC